MYAKKQYELYLEKLFDMTDKDNDGRLTYTETLQGVKEMGIQIENEQLLKIFDEMPGVDIECYADDVALVATGDDPEVLRERIQQAIGKAEAWATRNRLNFSTGKSEAVLFTRKNKYTQPSHLTINGEQIKYSQQFKYLGVWLDTKLTFRYHLGQKVKKVKFT